ncbi:MAG TPA: arylesterase [Pyrinomonadaceae bacterium]|nr:arylesterase [Pyrinomonadaceae bacterium]
MCRTVANKLASKVRQHTSGRNHIIRKSAFLSFILLSLVLTACQRQQGASRAENSANKPLKTPELVTNRPKIVAFGDSLTAGFGLTESESYPYLLQERLKADGYDYEVVNAGVSGDTSLGGLERIDWVLEQENVHILILELGANDLLRGAPVAKMKSNLDQMIRKAKAKNVKVLLCGMLAPPNGEYQRAFTSVFPDLAHEHETGFVPFVLDNIALKRELNQADGIHPNAEGEKIMTENIYRELRKML